MCTHYYKCPECGYTWETTWVHAHNSLGNCHKFTNKDAPRARLCGQGRKECVNKTAEAATKVVENKMPTPPAREKYRHYYKCPICSAERSATVYSTLIEAPQKVFSNPDTPETRPCCSIGKLCKPRTLEQKTLAYLEAYGGSPTQFREERFAELQKQTRPADLVSLDYADIELHLHKPGELAMKKPLVETKTFVSGVEVTHADKETLVDMLKQLEKEEDDLKKIRTESKAIAARIEEIVAARTVVATALDA